MTQDELKGAIIQANDLLSDMCLPTPDHLDAIKTLRNLAKSVLDSKMPEEKKGLVFLSNKELTLTGKLTEGRTLEDWIKYGYNQARSDFRLWQAKCLMNLEEIIEDAIASHLGIIQEDFLDIEFRAKRIKTISKDVFNRIRNLFGGTNE